MKELKTVKVLLKGKEVEVPKKASKILVLFSLIQIEPKEYNIERNVLKMYFHQIDKNTFKALSKVINPLGHQIANLEVNNNFIYLKVFNEEKTYDLLKQVLFGGEFSLLLRLQKQINAYEEKLDLAIGRINDKINL